MIHADDWDWALIEEVSARVRREPREALESASSMDACIERHLLDVAPLLTDDAHGVHSHRVRAHLVGLGPLDSLLDDPSVSEVMVNSGGEIWLERSGALVPVGRLPAARIEPIVERIIAPLGLRFDRTSPIVDARLRDGSRLCAVLPPIAVDGAVLSIRKFSAVELGIDAFTSETRVVDLVHRLVGERRNIVVSGATAAGKTTLLGALGSLLPHGERVVVIEDTTELRITTPNAVRLEARPATPDGVGAIDIRRLVRTSLRLRPDRIMIGEVRGDEAWDMVQALNTGHRGCLTTVHANSPADALRRITSLAANAVPNTAYEFVNEQVRSAIDAVVHVGRGSGGARRIIDVVEVSSPDSSGSALVPLLLEGPAGR